MSPGSRLVHAIRVSSMRVGTSRRGGLVEEPLVGPRGEPPSLGEPWEEHGAESCHGPQSGWRGRATRGGGPDSSLPCPRRPLSALLPYPVPPAPHPTHARECERAHTHTHFSTRSIFSTQVFRASGIIPNPSVGCLATAPLRLNARA